MDWREPDGRLSLSAGEVHVWRAPLDVPPEALRPLAALLSGEERTRADRLRIPHVRCRFTAGRGYLRQLLGMYLGEHPATLRFGYRPHGKPFLDRDAARADIRFNLSHSHGLALYAFTVGREIGVDLEKIRLDRDHDKLAARFFSRQEAAELQELPLAERVPAFFRCWTRKEAYLKARGEGLAVPLDSFSVSLTPGAPAALLEVGGEPAELDRWSMSAIEADPAFAAALAVEGPPAALRFFDWQADGGKPAVL